MTKEITAGEIDKYIEALEGIVNENQTKTDKNEEGVVKMLIKALADELLASYQYWVCKNLARGEGRHDAIEEFAQHEKEEKDHADKLMERIKQLGGKPIFNPNEWQVLGNPWTEVNTESVCEQLSITIKAEEDAIAYYEKMIDYCKGIDEVTMRLCRSILADECEHKYDLEMLKEEHCK